MDEIWQDIPGYSGMYQASTHGRIRSVDRVAMRKHRHGGHAEWHYKGRILQARPKESGHLNVSLGAHNTKKVHRLVLETFVGFCPMGMECLHIDGNPANNRIENLRWGTRFENKADERKHARLYGRRQGSTWLTVEIIRAIKRDLAQPDCPSQKVLAKKFSGVDPFMVEDIDQYIENAEKVLNAVRPVRETEVPLRQAADIEAISEYTTAQVERQEANKKAELLALNKYLVEAGIITDDMTAKEIQEMIDIIAAEEYEVENADKKLNFLKNRFEFMSGVIEEMIVNNKDIFTDEALDLTQSQKDLMREILKFDIDKLSVKQAAQVLEAMDNFINNGITSGLEAVVKGYIGNENANKLASSGLKSRPLKMYWNKAVGKFFGEQFVSLPLLIERMFPGMNKGLKLMSEMGLTDVIRGAAKADREHKMIMKDYTSQEFSKGKGFKKAENVYERGMIAFLSRNLAGTKTEMRNEFLRRVKMVEESINALMTGSETERKMGEAYQKIFDKLKVSSQDLDVIKANAEQMNLDAVNWMTQQWAEKYSDLSDISLSVYNAILGSDTNYTPDRYKGLDESDIKLDEKLLQRGSAFMGGLEYTDKNKSGVLKDTYGVTVKVDTAL